MFGADLGSLRSGPKFKSEVQNPRQLRTHGSGCHIFLKAVIPLNLADKALSKTCRTMLQILPSHGCGPPNLKESSLKPQTRNPWDGEDMVFRNLVRAARAPLKVVEVGTHLGGHPGCNLGA